MSKLHAAFIEADPESPVGLTPISRALAAMTSTGWIATSARLPATCIMSTRVASLTCHGLATTVHVFGELQVRDHSELRRRLEHASRAAEAASALTTLCWGRYVAFIEDAEGSCVMRDPSGASPLHIARFQHVRLAATHLNPSMLRAAGLRWRLNPSIVAKLLANPPAAGYLSGISEIEIAVPGRLHALRDRVAGQTVWRPAAFARRRENISPSVFASTLDAVLPSMTHPGGTGVELSGGFDSSVVFSSLARLGADPKPFNFITAGRGGDEARYARDTAAKWGIPLRTHSSGSELPDYRAFDHADHGVQPILHGLDSVFADARQRLIDREKLGRVLTGQGGDAIFFRLPSRLICLDRRMERGLLSLASHDTLDDARRVNGSIWSVIATGLGRRTGDDRPELDWMMSGLLGDAAREHLQGPQPKHPWLDEDDDMSPGKIFHVMMLSHCQLFHGRRLFSPSVEVAHPLLTQPMMELALACPTYRLQSGPIDRGLARAAFSDRLPASVLGRRSKGEASDHYARAILRNAGWLRDHLLAGRLADMEFLDRSRISRALEPGSLRLGTDYRSFVQYASVESWLRYWS